MEPNRYADPLEEALSHGSQRVAQFASLAGAMSQVVIQRRAIHDALVSGREDDRAQRALRQQAQALREQARLSYAPAHDPQWLAQADFVQTARAWGGAACFADSDPAASLALRRCEGRLRELHPYAMARYDRLRTEGMTPLDAMRETVPLFARSPTSAPANPPRPGPPSRSKPQPGPNRTLPSATPRPSRRQDLAKSSKQNSADSRSPTGCKPKPAPTAGHRSDPMNSRSSWQQRPTCRNPSSPRSVTGPKPRTRPARNRQPSSRPSASR